MQELEKILEEIEIKIAGSMGKKREGLLEAQKIIRKHMNDGWIPVEERLPEPYRPERSEIKLKPCPFCGVEAEVLDAYGGYTVKCRSCFCGTGIYKDSKRASEAWNRRADEQNE